MNALAKRRVDQAAGREQVGVLILLDDAAGQAGDDRAFGEDAAGELYILTSGGSVFRIVPR